jgi:hypothetical protein
MATMVLSEQEQQMLVELLEREIPSVREEILHTDTADYRDFLKDREYRLRELLNHLKVQTLMPNVSPSGEKSRTEIT